MTDLFVGLLIGAVLAAVVIGAIGAAGLRRLQERHRSERAALDDAVLELRQERAEDKETNRRLRHELVAHTPDRLIETAMAAELERDAAISERNQAIEQLHLVHQDLKLANGKLADSETKLRKYREALKEIRMSLEAQGWTRSLGATASMIDTGELNGSPAQAVAESQSAALIEPPVEPDVESQPEPVDLSAAD